LLPLFLAVLVLVASGCGSARAKAATVNGKDIPQSRVNDELEAIRKNKDYVTAIEQGGQGSQGVKVLGEAPGSFNAAFAARVLTREIIYELVLQEVDKRGIDVTENDISRAEQDLLSQVPQQIFEKFPKTYRDTITRWNANALVLQGALIGLPPVSQDAARAYFDKHPKEFEQACTSQILVNSEQEAREVQTLLLGGADFATLAKERSQDTDSAKNGGKLQCTFRGTLQPEYDKAAFSQPVGKIGEPIKTVFGWHVIRVDARRVPKYDSVVNDVQTRVQNLAAQKFNDWLRKAIVDAKVDVNPRFGSWDSTSGQVQAPDAPTTTQPTVPGSGAPPGSTPQPSGG
jgi:foldase protein PrsA